MSGLWLDFKIQSVEDQQKAYLPMNEITETLWYNKRIILDSNLYNDDSESRAWLVSKVNRVAPRGICNLTMTQDRYDQNRDYIEKDEDGNIVGMWADYFASAIAPEEIDPSTDISLPSLISKISYSGTTNKIKIGGAKTFTLSFYDDDLPVEHDAGEWSFLIGDENITDQLVITYPSPEKVKIKIPDNDDLIGKILSVVNTTPDGIVSSVDVELVAL